jgi:hypothetical protein
MLLQNRDLARELADKGKEKVQRDFLVTRLVRDELRLAKKVMLRQGRD